MTSFSYKDDDREGRRFFRNLAASTRSALTGRISPSAALMTVQQQQAAERLNLTAQERLAELRRGVGGQDLYNLSPRVEQDQGRSGGFFPVLGHVVGNAATAVGQQVVPQTSAAELGDIYRERTQGVADQLGTDQRFDFAGGDMARIDDFLTEQIRINIARRDAAVAEGQAEVAAAYDEQIKALREQQGKLATGRAAINEQYAGLQAGIEAQRTDILGQQFEGTDTDIEAEVAEVAAFYDQGQEGLNDLLQRIGADSPALAETLGADLAQFSELAEGRLREDLSNQAQVARAGFLFSQKAADAVAAETGVDAEGARSEIDTQIQLAIQGITDQIEQLEADKQDALQRVRDEIGDYDLTWLQDEAQVWDAFSSQWLSQHDMDFVQEAELMDLFNQVRSELPADAQTRSGFAAWARDNMIDANMGILADFFNTDISGLGELLVEMRGTLTDSFGNTQPDPDYNPNTDINRLMQAMSNPLAIEGMLEQLGLSVPELDWVEQSDYDLLLDLADLWGDFRAGGYDDFVNDVSAQASGSGISPNAIDGSTLTRSDMTRVTGPSGSTGYLHPGAADSFQEMVQAAADDGVMLSWSDTYRSWQTQHQAYTNFLETGRNLAGNVVPNIAHPDNSNHPRGLAVDFNTGGGALEWLRENGARFGWGPISNEDWHWEYRGSLGQYAGIGSTIGGGGTATTTTTTVPGTSPSGGGGSGGGPRTL